MFYNSQRLYSTLDYTSLNESELAVVQVKKSGSLGCHILVDHATIKLDGGRTTEARANT